jgi:hypothetical protein
MTITFIFGALNALLFILRLLMCFLASDSRDEAVHLGWAIIHLLIAIYSMETAQCPA